MVHRQRMIKAKKAAQDFLEFLRKDQDKAALIAFTDIVNVLSDFTNDFDSMKATIGTINAEGGTAIGMRDATPWLRASFLALHRLNAFNSFTFRAFASCLRYSKYDFMLRICS